MEQLIAVAALSIMVIGVIASIVGLIEFTQCFRNSPQDPLHTAAAAKPSPSTGNSV